MRLLLNVAVVIESSDEVALFVCSYVLTVITLTFYLVFLRFTLYSHVYILTFYLYSYVLPFILTFYLLLTFCVLLIHAHILLRMKQSLLLSKQTEESILLMITLR